MAIHGRRDPRIDRGPCVPWLPTGGDDDLLLQPGQPQALLDHLRELATTRARR